VPAQAVIALVLYDGENLSGLGTVITAVSATLVAGDVLRIEADDGDPELYRVKVNGVTVIQRSLTDDQISITNSCVGFVRVAAVTTIEIPEDEDQPMIANQAADQSKVNDTLADSDLSLPMEAGATYVGHVAAVFTAANTTPDVKYGFTAPALAEGLIIDPAWNYQTFALGASSSTGIGGGGVQLILQFTVRNGANAGNLTFQFAQNLTTPATATVMKKDSHMMMFKKV
jgi:hypothetical protein